MSDRPKTYKREVAAVLLTFLCTIIWQAAQADPIGTLQIIVWPFMLFAGAAWGMDWAGKSDIMKGQGNENRTGGGAQRAGARRKAGD